MQAPAVTATLSRQTPHWRLIELALPTLLSLCQGLHCALRCRFHASVASLQSSLSGQGSRTAGNRMPATPSIAVRLCTSSACWNLQAPKRQVQAHHRHAKPRRSFATFPARLDPLKCLQSCYMWWLKTGLRAACKIHSSAPTSRSWPRTSAACSGPSRGRAGRSQSRRACCRPGSQAPCFRGTTPGAPPWRALALPRTRTRAAPARGAETLSMELLHTLKLQLGLALERSSGAASASARSPCTSCEVAQNVSGCCATSREATADTPPEGLWRCCKRKPNAAWA